MPGRWAPREARPSAAARSRGRNENARSSAGSPGWLARSVDPGSSRRAPRHPRQQFNWAPSRRATKPRSTALGRSNPPDSACTPCKNFLSEPVGAAPGFFPSSIPGRSIPCLRALPAFPSPVPGQGLPGGRAVVNCEAAPHMCDAAEEGKGRGGASGRTSPPWPARRRAGLRAHQSGGRGVARPARHPPQPSLRPSRGKKKKKNPAT